jgi:hypothetical protein
MDEKNALWGHQRTTEGVSDRTGTTVREATNGDIEENHSQTCCLFGGAQESYWFCMEPIGKNDSECRRNYTTIDAILDHTCRVMHEEVARHKYVFILYEQYIIGWDFLSIISHLR